MNFPRLRFLLAFGLNFFFLPQSTFALHFVVYGDARTFPKKHQEVVDGIAKVKPELILFSGDLWDGYALKTEGCQKKFKSILLKNPEVAKLLKSNRYLVSRGNHEEVAELLSFKPTLVRENKEVYAFSQGNAFFVSLGMDPKLSLNFLDSALNSDEAKRAKWKFIFSHFPTYSSGDHGAQGSPELEKLCDKYHVDIAFHGHDHTYERTQQIFSGAIVDSTDLLKKQKGTVYIVSGGGGAPLYKVGHNWWTHYSESTLNFCDIVTTDSSATVTAKLPDGKAIDSFTIHASID